VRPPRTVEKVAERDLFVGARDGLETSARAREAGKTLRKEEIISSLHTQAGRSCESKTYTKLFHHSLLRAQSHGRGLAVDLLDRRHLELPLVAAVLQKA
jgi:hypothetical protein